MACPRQHKLSVKTLLDKKTKQRNKLTLIHDIPMSSNENQNFVYVKTTPRHKRTKK